MKDTIIEFCVNYPVLIFVCVYIVPATWIILKEVLKKHEPHNR